MPKAKLEVPLSPLILWRHRDRPIEWDQVFSRSAPLDLEIGFGRGEFFSDYAKAHPDRNLVAIEIRYPSIVKGLRRLATSRFENVRLIHENAHVALERVFDQRSISRMFALFPCPWPKDKHIKYRLFSSHFLGLMNSRLVEDGEIKVVTDHWPFLNWILDQVPGTGFVATWSLVPPTFGTKYEDKWRSQGQEEFFDLRLRKTKHIEIPFTGDWELKAHRIPKYRADRLRPHAFSAEVSGPSHVKIHEVIHDSENIRTMIRATVAEDSLTQGVWIEIKPKDEAHLVSAARGCAFVPTAGIQRAIDFVRDLAVATNES